MSSGQLLRQPARMNSRRKEKRPRRQSPALDEHYSGRIADAEPHGEVSAEAYVSEAADASGPPCLAGELILHRLAAAEGGRLDDSGVHDLELELQRGPAFADGHLGGQLAGAERGVGVTVEAGPGRLGYATDRSA